MIWRVDITGPDVVGSMVDVLMLTLASLPVRMFPSCVQVIEVSGTLKIVMVTDKMKAPPVREAVWPLATLTRGGTIVRHSKITCSIPSCSAKRVYVYTYDDVFSFRMGGVGDIDFKLCMVVSNS